MDESYVVRRLEDIHSPALLVYPDKIKANIERALSIAGGPARLRPHVKTHKTAEIVRLMLAAGIRKFKCATIAEAEMLAEAGARDVLLAFQPAGPNLRRFAALCAAHPGVDFSTLFDNSGTARELSAALAAAHEKAGLYLDLDVGQHRTGVEPGQPAVELYRSAARLSALEPRGIHAYDGHNHQRDPEERRAAAAQCYRAALEMKSSLEAAGLPAPALIMGGTPTFPAYAAYPEPELSPGTCFLSDAETLYGLPDLPFQPAALLLGRVISLPGLDRVTIDIGHKAVSADPAGQRGYVLNYEGFEALGQSEEHWVWRVRNRSGIGLGSPVYLLPTHICPTMALHRELHPIRDGAAAGRWKVTARDRMLSI